MHNIRHIEAYLPKFGYILADSGIVRILAQLDIFIYIKVYSEPTLIQAYSEPLTYLASSRYYSRAMHAYSERYLSRFRHI